MSEDGNGNSPAEDHQPHQATLTVAVLRRRADEAFFLRLRDAMAQNHRALERLGS
ncbi:MAG TPA: hypothetical protein VG298_09330 [Acidimicrobiales bacterium]|nr:hypothetical protein [Acidimicrobiales bacterium]